MNGDPDNYYAPMSPWDCAKKFYAVFQIIGVQLPDIASLMISIERVLAVSLPFWYRAKFNARHRFGLFFASILMCTISLMIYFLTVFPLQEKNIQSGYCALTYSSNLLYNKMHQYSTVIIQVAAFSLSSFAFIQARRNSIAVAAMRKEIKSVKPILIVSFLSVILVTVPQIYLSSLRIFGVVIVDLRILLSILLLPCINSFLNFFVYLWLMKEFRSEVWKILSLGKIGSQSNTVGTVGVNQPTIRIGARDRI
jgi:hypothetical protein